MSPSRRQALRRFWSWALASPLLAQEFHDPRRLPPLEGVINAPEFEEVARLTLARPVFDRIAAGAGSERTLRRNREYFERVTFRPRMLVDVSRLDASIELFGERLAAPIIAGPTARHARVAEAAERATAEGCVRSETLLTVSERASLDLSEIAATGAALWRQLSPASPSIAAAVEEAERLGCRAVVLTIDGEPAPRFDRDVHNRVGRAPAAARRPDAREALRQAVAATRLPVVVKGVLRPADALAALDSGAAAVCVSNRGGRAVDGVPAAVEALPAVAEAVAGRAPVLVDGGFRRGSDILKALALGASAVLLGRPVLWALGSYGADGVARLFELLRSELALAMGLSGVSDIASIRRESVKIHRW